MTLNEKRKLWRDANPDKVKASRDKWNQSNKDKLAGYNKKWNEDNKEANRAINLERQRAYRKTKVGVVTCIYGGMKVSSKRRQHPAPNFSSKELREWIFSQPNFEQLYTDWVASDYSRWMKPSCDRIDSSLPYTFDNLQLMTWRENDKKEKSNL